MAVAKPEPTTTAAATRELWSAGDYSAVSTRVMIAAEDLCETADVRGGQRALDVASFVRCWHDKPETVLVLMNGSGSSVPAVRRRAMTGSRAVSGR